MDIYSKELLTAQENYLYLLDNDAGNLSLLKAAENRLLLLGFSSSQVKALKSTGKSSQFVTIFSPYSGHLHDLVSAKPTGTMSETSESSSQELTVKEGMYVEKGQTIFNIFDTGKLWVLLNVYPDGAGMVKTGQNVILSMDAQNIVKIAATIDFIEPVISNEQRTIRARVYLNNRHSELKIGTIVKATIQTGSKYGVFIPSTALGKSGKQRCSFCKRT